MRLFSDLLDREPLPKLPIVGVLFLPRDHYPVQGVKFPPWPRGRGTALKCPTARLPAVELVILRWTAAELDVPRTKYTSKRLETRSREWSRPIYFKNPSDRRIRCFSLNSFSDQRVSITFALRTKYFISMLKQFNEWESSIVPLENSIKLSQYVARNFS